MARVVYRIQDAEGRGPFRPGFSRRWVEDRAELALLPPWHQEFPDVTARARALVEVAGGACGCGVAEPAGLARWFTPLERRRLRAFGFRAVRLTADRVLAESANQLVFWRALPLAEGAEAVGWK